MNDIRFCKFQLKRGHSVDIRKCRQYQLGQVQWYTTPKERLTYIVFGRRRDVSRYVHSIKEHVKVIYGLRRKPYEKWEEFRISDKGGLAANWYETPDGECWYAPTYYNHHVDLEAHRIVNDCEAYPTIQELEKCGYFTLKTAWKSHDINFPQSVTEVDLGRVRQEFAAQGFFISEESLRHNYDAWRDGFKSGFRDTNCHVFTPSGDNPLSFRVTTLHPFADNWQKTYIA